MKAILSRVVLPVFIVGSSVACAGAMKMLGKKADRTPTSAEAVAVEVAVAEQQDSVPEVAVTGTVSPEQQVSMVPEVSGRVIYVAPQLVDGGRFEKGETLLRIYARDYELAIEGEKARVRQAEVELQLEEARQQTAQREWEMLGDDKGDSPLALRRPQLQLARQNLEAARASLERAQLNLERTSLRAPFDAVVLSEQVDVGQVVMPGAGVVTLAGTDAFRVEISLPVERLPLIGVPGIDGTAEGSEVDVVQTLGPGQRVERTGRVIGLGGQIDAQTRTARLLVRVDHPLDGPGLPLLPGSYVTATVHGRALAGSFTLPEVALFEGGHMWVVGEGDTLRHRDVVVGWRDGTDVVVTDGLESGDRVVLTPIALPIEGMPVRVIDPGEGA